MRLVWTQEAITKLENIHHYLAEKEKAPEVARAVVARLIARAPGILDMPLAGKQVPDYNDANVREIQENPYRIIYYLGEDTIYILSVMHHKQLIPDYLTIQP